MAERPSEIVIPRLAELEARLDRLEAAVRHVLQHIGSDYDLDAATEPEYMPHVRELIRAGKATQAIKVYQDHTGAGIKDAKAVIDELAAR
jgi:ribosomal protein L7/L12